ncbi:MAG: O-antigen ligase family protein [Candidatus Nomurabacteria bacterium]|nr:O-antigen ligase family protein [Candidatus Nomurabacteria bacterium]
MLKKINDILKYGSYLLVFILPIFYIGVTFYPYTGPKTFLFYGLVEILTAFWIYALVVDPSYRLSKKTLLYFLPLFGFIVWMTISGVVAVNPHLAFWSSIGRGTGLLTLYHSLFFALIVASLIKRNGLSYLYKLMHWFINGGFILGLSILFGNQGFDWIPFLENSSGGGLMGNSSLAAPYLMFVLAFGVFILTSKSTFIEKKGWLITKLAVILFSPLFINIHGFMTGDSLFGVARGATLGLIVSVGVALVFYLFISKKKVLRILGGLGIIFGIVAFSFVWIQLINPNTKLHQKFTEVASGTRFVFDEISQKSMDKYPYFGYGPENYMIAFQENLNPKMALSAYNYEVWADRGHNIYYDTGVSGGYPAIAFYAFFILSILYGLYLLRNREMFNNIQISILAGLIIGYVFQNLFVFDSALSVMVLYVLAGIVFIFINDTKEEKHTLKPLNTFTKDILPSILGVICLILLIFFSIRPMIKVFNYYTVAQMSMNTRGDHYVDLLEGSSLGQDWDVSEIVSHIYKLYNQDPVKIKNDKTMAPYAITDIKALIAYSEKILAKNHHDARLNISTIALYNTLNYYTDNPYDPVLGDHIFKLLDNMKYLSSNNPETYWIMAQTYIWKQDYNGVVDSYNKAIAVDASIPDSHQLLLKFAKGTGNQKLYDQALTQAQKDIPGFVMKD